MKIFGRLQDNKDTAKPTDDVAYSIQTDLKTDTKINTQTSNQAICKTNNYEVMSEEELNQIKLTKKLQDLKLKVRPEQIVRGPVVTTYYFTNWSPISKILNAGEDLALAIGAESCIVSRSAGHIIVSVPNKERKNVDFKENLYWYLHNEEVAKAKIPIPLGMDIVGNKSYFDLTDMPHCLIAGSTGAGKSVFLANIITSICYRFSSDDISLFLVDTKRVDLPLFKSLPHVKALADDIKSFHNEICFQTMGEIRRRLGEFQNLGVRNIGEYHARGLEMPYIVIIIDELGDVLDLDKSLDRRKDGAYEGVPTVKAWLNQVARIARAAGVHIIACTQRSSVKVVDGDIKANLPCRIALRLPTGIDSRTILGENGAEYLLGKGDMLIQRPEKDIIERYHGPFVDMKDINELVSNYEQMRSVLNA
jgi:DNA segregation ATPase FtsK/SpoIIIE, S-DNA-T family